MAAHDEEHLDADDLAAHRTDGGGALLGDDGEGPVDRAVTAIRHGIDQVADKVEGLLRSDR